MSIAVTDGNLTFNKNPRELHLSLQLLPGAAQFSLIQTEKYCLPRELLDERQPVESEFLDGYSTGTLARWLAGRYVRAAFPSAFNNRIDEVARADKKLSAQAKKVSHIVSGIYLNINPKTELTKNEQYSVNMLALVPAGQEVDLESEDIVKPLEAMAELLRKAGMEVTLSIQFEDKVPFSIFRRDFQTWDFESISLREEPQGPVPI